MCLCWLSTRNSMGGLHSRDNGWPPRFSGASHKGRAPHRHIIVIGQRRAAPHQLSTPHRRKTNCITCYSGANNGGRLGGRPVDRYPTTMGAKMKTRKFAQVGHVFTFLSSVS